jgi:hypothetical protein
MKVGKVFVYFLILVALISWVYFYELGHKTKKLEEKKKASRLISLTRDAVIEVDLTTEGKPPIILQKLGDTWVVSEPIKTKADKDPVDSLLASGLDAEHERVIQEKDVNWGEYGLDKPEFTVRFQTKDGKDTISFGASNPAKTSFYARVNDDPRLFLVADTLKNSLNKNAFDVREKTVLGIAPDDIERVVITDKGKETELVKEGPNKWTAAKPDRMRLKGDLIGRVLIDLTNLSAKEIIDEPAQTGDPYGLDKPEEEILLGGKKLEQVIQLGKGDDQSTPMAAGRQRYVRIKGRDAVYKVDPRVLTMLKTDPEKLRDKSLLSFEMGDVEKIDIDVSGRRWVFAKDKDKNWHLELPEKKKLETWSVSALLWDLKSLEWKTMVSPIPADLAPLRLDKPQLVLTMSRANQQEPLVLKAGWPETATEKPTASKEDGKSGESTEQSAPSPQSAEKPAVTAAAKPGIPETVNVMVIPCEEKDALFVMDSRFVRGLETDLKQMTEDKK